MKRKSRTASLQRSDRHKRSATQPQRLDLDVYLPHHLTVIANRWARGSSRIYLKRFGIGVNEWRILSMIAVEPGVTAQRASALTSVDKGIVSRSVSEMGSQGLISVAIDPQDARRTFLTLTKKGIELHDRIVQVALERQKRLVSGMSPEEIKQFARVLKRMRENLSDVNAAEFMNADYPVGSG